MGYCIAVAQQKGGVGKTTTVINLGAALAEQSNAGLGINPPTLEASVYDVLHDDRRPLQSVVLSTETGCDFIPANIDLAGTELKLASEIGRATNANAPV